MAGAGLFVALAYLLPAVSAIVAGYFLDDVAEVVERTDFPQDPMGRPLPLGRALLYGLRFAGLSLVVNLVALLLFFVPLVNIGVFFAANAYLLGREYFELAAGRFRPIEEASRMRQENRGTVLLAGAHARGPRPGAGPEPAHAALRRGPDGSRAQAPSGPSLAGPRDRRRGPGSKPDPGPVERGAGRSWGSPTGPRCA